MMRSLLTGLGVAVTMFLSSPAARAADPAKPLTLQDCIDLAMERNAQIRSSERQIERTSADILQARSALLPSVNTTLLGFGRSISGPSVRVQQTPIGFDPVTGQPRYEQKEVVIESSSRSSYSMSLSLGQTIYDGGRSLNGLRQARTGRTAALHGLSAQRKAIKLAVERQYYGLLKAQELIVVQKEALARSRKQLERAQSLLAIGSGIEADVLRSKVAVGNDRISLLDAENSLRAGRAEMCNILGLDISTELAVADSVQPPRGLPDLQWAEERAMAANPRLRQQEAAVKAAQLGASVARGAYYPLVNANVSYGRYGEEFGRVYNQFDKNYQISVSTGLSVNVFDGFSRRASLNRARSSMLAAREDLEQTKRDIALAVQKAFLDVQRSAQASAISRENIASADEDFRLADERYKVGAGTLLEVIDAQLMSTQAHAKNIQAQYDLKIAEAEIEYAMGGEAE